MVIQVDVESVVPVLIVDTATNEGVPGLSLSSRVSANGAPFADGPALTEIGGGWYSASVSPAEVGFLILTVDGGSGNSTWRDIIEVWAMEPVIPIMQRTIRMGTAT